MINKNKIFFIYIKWAIFSLFLTLNSKGLSATDLKKVDILSYISDFEEYNNQIVNKNPKGLKKNQNIAAQTITKISTILTKEMFIKKEKSERLSTIIAFAAKKYDIDPRIMISIMKVESNFKQNAINLTSCERTKEEKCGDYSIAQINYEVWSRSFPKMGRKPLDLYRLKTDETYSIFRMAEILSILKSQYAQVDSFWFARYHSSTESRKLMYQSMLKKELKKVIALGPDLLKNFPKTAKSIP